MSINYCTIAATTVDTFCGNRRALVLARLIPELHPITPPNPQPGNGSHGSVAPGWSNYRPQPQRWEPPVISTERDRIVVKAEFQDLRGEDQQDIENRLDIVFVTNLHVEQQSAVSVNISNIKVN